MDVPSHVGIIMDGNRRFSKRLMLQPWKGHEWGAKKVEKILDWCRELGVRELTLYTFSIQNFGRPKEEFDYLMKIFLENFEKLKKDDRLSTHGIRINFIGRLEMFPENIQKSAKEIMELTKNNANYIVNFAMAYGGQEEIVDAAKKIAQKVMQGELKPDDIDNATISENLYISSCPDLVIRTGGERRSSNFLPFQTVYSEWFYLDKMWPEFEKEDFQQVLEEFSQRKRRFGK